MGRIFPCFTQPFTNLAIDPVEIQDNMCFRKTYFINTFFQWVSTDFRQIDPFLYVPIISNDNGTWVLIRYFYRCNLCPKKNCVVFKKNLIFLNDLFPFYPCNFRERLNRLIFIRYSVKRHPKWSEVFSSQKIAKKNKNWTTLKVIFSEK